MSIAIAIDTGSSCGQFFYSRKALDRLKSDFGGQDVRLLTFSDHVHYDGVVDLNNMRYSGIRFRGGGSSLKHLVKLLEEGPPDHLVLVTDGFLSYTNLSRVAGVITLWLYEEMHEPDLNLMLKGMCHENIFVEVLEQKTDGDGNDLNENARCKNVEEWKSGWEDRIRRATRG